MPALNSPAKRKLVALCCVIVITGSLTWIFLSQRGRPAAAAQPHIALGRVLAEETVKLLGKQGRVVVISPNLRKELTVKWEVDSFTESLKRQGSVEIQTAVTIQPFELSLKDPQKGFAGDAYLSIVRKHSKADAIISFVGLPQLADTDLHQLSEHPQKLIAVSRSRKNLEKFLNARVTPFAIVPRFKFPSPVTGKPRNSREWFDKYFQIVRSPSELPSQRPD